jgi:rhamnogalacturonan acetylesterase
MYAPVLAGQWDCPGFFLPLIARFSVIEAECEDKPRTNRRRARAALSGSDPLLCDMNTLSRLLTRLCLFAVAAATLGAQDAPAPDTIATKPTIFIAGDSTAQAGNPVAVGWGKAFADYFDPARVTVANRAMGGRSSRTFVSEGRWDRLAAELKPGDFVLIQFGHNDGGPVDRLPARGSLPRLGDETREIEHPTTKAKETVLTFGAYLRSFVAEIRERGATPVICSLVPRNRWADGRIARTPDRHDAWARAVAETEDVAFVDLHERIATRYDAMGEEAVLTLFADRTVHTNWEGAVLNASIVVEGLRALPENPLAPHLRPGM